MLHEVVPPPPPARPAPNTEAEVRALLDALPAHVKPALAALCATAGHEVMNLVELNVQIGRRPEAVFVAAQASPLRGRMPPARLESLTALERPGQ